MSEINKKIIAQLDLSNAEQQMSSFISKYQNISMDMKINIDAPKLDNQLQTQVEKTAETAGMTFQKLFEGAIETTQSKIPGKLSDLAFSKTGELIKKSGELIKTNYDQPQITGCPCFPIFQGRVYHGEEYAIKAA